MRSAWGITLWTFVSRLTGLLRDATIARFLGASAASDAFWTAFRIPNAFRAILGEGGLPGAFVPMAKKVARERPGQEGIYAGRMFTALLAVLVVVVALGVVFAPTLVTLFASGFRNTPGKFELTVYLTRLLFPYILLVSLASLLESYLNSKGRFQLAAATPVALNLSIVLAAYALAPLSVPVPVALCIGVIAGGLAQLLMQAPLAKKLGFVFGGSPAGDPEVARTALQIAPRLYGYGIGQINFLISSRTLSRLGDAFITYNFNAFRVVDLVQGGFVVSMTKALLPSLSEQALDEDKTAFEKSILFGLRLVAFATVPATLGLMLLGGPVIDVIFRRGEFGVDAVRQTAHAVFFFAIGLFASSAVKILTQAFFALQDTKTPFFVATFDLVAFWILCVTLASSMSHAGVALATAAGFWINFLVLFVLLKRRVSKGFGRTLVPCFARLFGATLAMGVFVIALAEKFLPYQPAWSLFTRIGWLGVVIGSAAAVFAGAAWMLKAPELEETFGALLRRRRKA